MINYILFFIDPGTYYNTITLTPKNYTLTTLATELETQLNTLYDAAVMEFTVSYNLFTMKLTVTMDDKTPGNTHTFRFLTDEELQAGEYNSTPIANPKSANGILQNTGTSSIYSEASPYETNVIDLHNIRNLYMTSNLGNYSVLSNFNWTGSDIIKKIPINVATGSILYDNVIAPFDMAPCGGQTLRTLNFKLVDAFNNVIDIQNHFSFSIIFGLRE